MGERGIRGMKGMDGAMVRHHKTSSEIISYIIVH